MIDEQQLNNFRFVFASDLPVRTQYPELSIVFPEEVSEDVIKYVVFAYDQESPFVRNIVDLNQRKLAVADYVSLEEREGVINLTDADVVELIVQYLFWRSDRKRLAIEASMQALYEYTKLIMTPLDQQAENTKDKDVLSAATLKSKLMEDVETINDRLDKYFESLTDDKELQDQLNRRVTPSVIAQRISNATTL